MATAREVKKRIRSVKNISQITRALEAVSASRVRKAQARVLASRAFAEKAWEILLNIQKAASKGTSLHPLLTARPDVKQVMVVLITSDRGLAGAFNSNIIRMAQRFATRIGKPVRYVTVGKKGRDSLIRARANVVAEFSGLPADPTIASISPIAKLAIDEFLSGKVDDVFIAYTDFINTLTQRPAVLSWLPMTPFMSDDQVIGEMLKGVPDVSSGQLVYEYEPGAEAILNEIVPRFTELQLYHALLESQASEHSARMVAMRNASDNATQLMGDLTLVYNKARQAAITAEILDIVGGANALQASIDQVADEILSGAPSNGTPPKVAYEVIQPKAAPRDVSKVKGATKDNLRLVEGIGPKVEEALHKAGIKTFAQLAEMSSADLERIVKVEGGVRIVGDAATWPKQAQYVVKGDMEGLKAYQDKLVGGREVE